MSTEGAISGTADHVRDFVGRVLHGFWESYTGGGHHATPAAADVSWDEGRVKLFSQGALLDEVPNGTATLKIEIRVNGGASNT